MELLTNIQTINFKMTIEQLHQRIMDTVIMIEMPILKGKIEELYRTNTKDTLILSEIEEKLLSMFS